MSNTAVSSRSASTSSFDTSATSIFSEDFDAVAEKLASVTPQKRPIVLHWEPIMFSTAFTSNTSTRLHFTAFPPHDLQKPLFGQLSLQSAEVLLHQFASPTRASFLARNSSKVEHVDHIPFPSSLPRELMACLEGPEWQYLHISENAVPTSIGFSASFDHHVAIRRIHQGVERYIFGPAGLCIHSVCRIEDVGPACAENIPRETLFLREDVEVVCNKLLKWWTARLIADQVTATHEQLRRDWDDLMRYEWDVIKKSKDTDLLV